MDETQAATYEQILDYFAAQYNDEVRQYLVEMVQPYLGKISFPAAKSVAFTTPNGKSLGVQQTTLLASIRLGNYDNAIRTGIDILRLLYRGFFEPLSTKGLYETVTSKQYLELINNLIMVGAKAGGPFAITKLVPIYETLLAAEIIHPNLILSCIGMLAELEKNPSVMIMWDSYRISAIGIPHDLRIGNELLDYEEAMLQDPDHPVAKFLDQYSFLTEPLANYLKIIYANIANCQQSMVDLPPADDPTYNEMMNQVMSSAFIYCARAYRFSGQYLIETEGGSKTKSSMKIGDKISINYLPTNSADTYDVGLWLLLSQVLDPITYRTLSNAYYYRRGKRNLSSPNEYVYPLAVSVACYYPLVDTNYYPPLYEIYSEFVNLNPTDDTPPEDLRFFYYPEIVQNVKVELPTGGQVNPVNNLPYYAGELALKYKEK